MVRIHPDPPTNTGGLAQLGEHLLCKQGVVGSIPSSSTSPSGRHVLLHRQEGGSGWKILAGERAEVRREPDFWFFTSGCLFFKKMEEVKRSWKEGDRVGFKTP